MGIFFSATFSLLNSFMASICTWYKKHFWTIFRAINFKEDCFSLGYWGFTLCHYVFVLFFRQSWYYYLIFRSLNYRGICYWVAFDLPPPPLIFYPATHCVEFFYLWFSSPYRNKTMYVRFNTCAKIIATTS